MLAFTVGIAAKLEQPKDVKLKDPKEWKVIGKPLARLDTADKVTGKQVYGFDLKLPGMLNAAIKDCPVFGGKVVRAPTPMHGKLSGIAHKNQSVFEDVPSPFQATRYHSLVVDRAGFPKDLEVTAETGEIIMGLRHKSLPIHGVQFHPESIASEHGHALLANFLEICGIEAKAIA